MTPGKSEAFATRLSAEEAEQIREALADIDRSRSDLLARAVRYYMDENPDGIPAFREDEREYGPIVKAGILPPDLGSDETGFEDR